MNTAAIYIRTQPEVKAKAQKIAKNLELSLSSLMGAWLKQFVKTKRVTFSAEDERPSKYLIESLKESEEDLKAGRVLSFDSGEAAVKYFQSLENTSFALPVIPSVVEESNTTQALLSEIPPCVLRT